MGMKTGNIGQVFSGRSCGMQAQKSALKLTVRSCLVAAAGSVAGLMAMSAQAAMLAPIVNVDTPLEAADTWTIGQPSSGVHADAVTAGAYYSDDTNFSGSAVFAGSNGTTKYTALLADDINTIATAPFVLGQFSWSIANGATVSQTISPLIRFYDTTGTGGGPGNLLGGLNFNGIAVPAGNVSGFFYNASASAITLPTSFWACEYFSTTGTVANAGKIGQGTFNPVDVGSSNDEDFTSSTVGSASANFTAANPAGTVNVSPFAGTPVANFEWEFNPVAPVPEPTTLALLVPAALIGLSRRRRMV